MAELNREDRIATGRVKHGVGQSPDLAGNVCHLVSPIVGSLRLDERDGNTPTQDEIRWMIDRLSLVLDLANEHAEEHLDG